MFVALMLINGFLSVMSGCRPNVISDVDELRSGRNALSSFARIASDIPESKRMQICSLEQLYLHANHADVQLQEFASSGSAWNFVDHGTSKKYDYIVHPNLSGALASNAVFVALPRLIVVDEGRMGRLVLTHSLEIKVLQEDEYHLIVLKQLDMKIDQPIDGGVPTTPRK